MPVSCSQPVEFSFDTREEYEEELRKLITQGKSGSKEYDRLIDEYLEFCKTDGK